MSAPVAAPAPTPLSRIAFGGFGRVGLAGLVLVLAAVIVTMSGGAGLAGRIGSLFGVQSHAKSKPIAAVEVAGPVKAVVNSVRQQATPAAHSQRQVVRRRVSTRRHAGGTPQQSPAPGAPRPAPALPPSQPAPPPVVPKPPPPAPSGNVERTVTTVHNTAAPVVPQAQPVLDQAQQTVSQACGLIRGCP